MKRKQKTTTEEKILGKAKKEKVVTPRDYESKEILYRVTNILSPNTPITVRGDVIETFIGCRNIVAREGLRAGEKMVYTYDITGRTQYKIELLKRK